MKPEALLSQLPHLDALEENVANALHLLHPHNISFPVFPDQIQFSVPSTYDCRCGDISSFRLFLPLNYKARWASSKLPPTWKADELSRVKSLFFILKVLTRLGAAPTLLDLSTQEVLTTSLTDHNYVFLHHEDYCLGIAPIIPELAHRIAYNLVSRGKAEESLKALESFFNGPMLLPEPGTSPHTIYENFACLRSRIIHEKYSSSSSSSSTYLDPDLEAKLLLDSPVTFTRLFCCRAEIATTLEEPDLEQWWLTAMNLHDEFPPSEEYTRLDTICATDMYGVRRRARQR
ncbi:hypothetical protein F5Y10DRAFT_279995 [Nemania abortiva]|nr:hypothetical protein F5Y10DRAFT_279995 [Nemania abortiva]